MTLLDIALAVALRSLDPARKRRDHGGAEGQFRRSRTGHARRRRPLRASRQDGRLLRRRGARQLRASSLPPRAARSCCAASARAAAGAAAQACMSAVMSDYDDFMGTRPVADAHRFDVGALERYLRASVDGFAGPLTVAQFKGGQSNPTFVLSTPGKVATCCAASRRASCCPRRTPWIASIRVISRARGHRRAGAAHVLPVHRRRGDRHHVLRHGARRGPRAVGPAAARNGTGRAAARFSTR